MNGSTATINQYYSAQIVDLGLELKGAVDNARDRRLVSDSLAALGESVGGVSWTRKRQTWLSHSAPSRQLPA
jgi:hypothetical protein